MKKNIKNKLIETLSNEMQTDKKKVKEIVGVFEIYLNKEKKKNEKYKKALNILKNINEIYKKENKELKKENVSLFEKYKKALKSYKVYVESVSSLVKKSKQLIENIKSKISKKVYKEKKKFIEQHKKDYNFVKKMKNQDKLISSIVTVLENNDIELNNVNNNDNKKLKTKLSDLKIENLSLKSELLEKKVKEIFSGDIAVDTPINNKRKKEKEDRLIVPVNNKNKIDYVNADNIDIEEESEEDNLKENRVKKYTNNEIFENLKPIIKEIKKENNNKNEKITINDYYDLLT